MTITDDTTTQVANVADVRVPTSLPIDGQGRESSTGETFSVIDPCTSEVIAHVAPSCSCLPTCASSAASSPASLAPETARKDLTDTGAMHVVDAKTLPTATKGEH